MDMFSKTPLAALLLAALLSPAASAGANAVLPADLPAFAADKPLPVPAIEKKSLANGIEVWVVPRSGVPRVDFVLAFKDVALMADSPETPAFGSMLAGLLTEGTTAHDSKTIAELAQGYGGGVGGSASSDGLVINANALASQAAPMLALLAEIARSPSFPEKEVQLAKVNALQGLKAAEAQPGYRAERAMLTALYGDHPYARTQATEAGITAVTRDQLVAEYQRRLRPDRALLVITGRIAATDAFAMAQKALGDWKVDAAEPVAIAKARGEAMPTRIHLDRPGSVQSTLRIGRPAIAATHADFVPLRLTSTILGGGFSSRLMQNLREDKGYTYGAGLGMRAQAHGGALIGSSDVRNEVTGAALSEFFGEYRRIGSEPVSADELDMNKRYVAGGYLIANQMQGAVAGTLAYNWLAGLPAEFLGQYVPMVRAVSAEQVQAMGHKYFQPAQQSMVVVGDQSVLTQLKPYGAFVEAK